VQHALDSCLPTTEWNRRPVRLKLSNPTLSGRAQHRVRVVGKQTVQIDPP